MPRPHEKERKVQPVKVARLVRGTNMDRLIQSESHFPKIIKLMQRLSLEIGIGLTLDGIHQFAKTGLTLDTLRAYLGKWDVQELLSIDGEYGSRLVILKFREDAKKPYFRRPVISLDQVISSWNEGDDEASTPLIDSSGQSVIQQYLDPSAIWSYPAFIESVAATIRQIKVRIGSSANTVQLVNQYYPLQVTERAQQQAGVVEYTRQIIFVSAMSILDICERFGMCDQFGNVINVREEFGIDKRWFSLLPLFWRLREICRQADLPLQLIADALSCPLLFSDSSYISDDQSLVVNNPAQVE